MGADAAVGQAETASAEPAGAADGGHARRGEPLLVSLDEIVSDIRVLGGAVEASSSARRDEDAG